MYHFKEFEMTIDRPVTRNNLFKIGGFFGVNFGRNGIIFLRVLLLN